MRNYSEGRRTIVGRNSGGVCRRLCCWGYYGPAVSGGHGGLSPAPTLVAAALWSALVRGESLEARAASSSVRRDLVGAQTSSGPDVPSFRLSRPIDAACFLLMEPGGPKGKLFSRPAPSQSCLRRRQSHVSRGIPAGAVWAPEHALPPGARLRTLQATHRHGTTVRGGSIVVPALWRDEWAGTRKL
ncbi:hypothetical protein MTO96_011664 [Rhipicephalus appendiculatus]